MWKRVMRGERGTPFTELGNYASLDDAARVILKRENDQSGAVLFLVYVDPSDSRDDAAVLSRLDYQSARHYYLLTRSTN